MSERNTRTYTQTEINEPRSQSRVEFDLTPLTERSNFHATISFLNSRRIVFDRTDWQGGVDPKMNFSDVRDLLTVLYKGEISPQLLDANSKLAIAQAFAVAGANIKPEIIESLKKKAEQESVGQRDKKWTETAKELELQLGRPKRRWLRKAAIALPPLAIAATYLGRELNNSNSDSDVSDSQPRSLEVSEELNDEKSISNSVLQLPSFLSNIGNSLEEVVKPIPKVEELNEEDDNPYTRWGFNFALPEVKQGEEIDPSNFIIFEWENDKVTQVNGEILGVASYPVKDTGGRNFSEKCLRTPNIDCSKVVGNFIIVGVHSGVVTNSKGELIELAMESIRAFIEGHKLEYKSEADGSLTPFYTATWLREEIEQRIDLLEEERVTINLWGHQAKAQVAVVRIEEVDRDSVYADWNRAVETALKYDPSLGERINLERGGVILAISGRRLPGDRLSGQNHYEYTSSLILIFIGEPAGS